MKIKEQATQAKTDLATAYKNGERLVQAVSLLTISGFSAYALRELTVHPTLQYVVIAALSVIALRGAWEFFRFLAEKK